MRDALGIDKSVDILDHVHSLPEKEQEEAQKKLHAIETAAMVDMEAQPGNVLFNKPLRRNGIN